MDRNLSIASYNINGYKGAKSSYIKSILMDCDVLCIQEHWMLPGRCQSLLSDLDCQGVVLSSMNENVITSGRPYGGVGFIWRKNLIVKYKILKFDCAEICGIKILLNNVWIGLFNVYMPCDGHDELKYLDMLNEIRHMCVLGDIDRIIVGGDFNTELSRSNSEHTSSLLNFVNTERLCLCKNLSISEVDYTYESFINGVRSTLDHFLVSFNLRDDVVAYRSKHSVDNMSDHSHVQLVLKLSVKEVLASGSDNSIHFDWRNANRDMINNYKACLDNNLGIACQEDITANDYYQGILNSCLSAANACVPRKKRRRKRIFRWNELVRDSRVKALFWHNLWMDNGRPVDGIVFDIRKSTRKAYHKAIKDAVRTQELAAAEEITSNANSKDYASFWKGVRKVKDSKNIVSSVVDDYCTPNDIVNAFALKYEALYNSVGYTDEWAIGFRKGLDEEVEGCCKSGKCNGIHLVSGGDVKFQVVKMKSNKTDVKQGISSENFKFGTEKLYVDLGILFSKMLKTGEVPTEMCLSTLIPIAKDKRKSLCSSDNYRSIALSSLILKLFEDIMLLNSGHVFTTSNLQFGFKKHHSTSQCAFVLQEIVSYFVSNGNNVFVVFLDCSKAFDRVNYRRLFTLLQERKMCPSMLRVLWSLYSQNVLEVKWEGCLSNRFAMSNGVKQGGKSSPSKFNLYIDELFSRLEKSGYGCEINGEYYGSLGYADDLALIAASKYHLLEMLKICSKFANEVDLTFNPSKSVYMVFGNNKTDADETIIFNDVTVKSVSSTKYLGHWISSKPVCCYDYKPALGEYAGRVNSLCSSFSFIPYDIKYTLCQILCQTLYGCEIWRINDFILDKIDLSWRKSIRKLCQLPYRTHSRYLPFLVDHGGLQQIVFSRIIGFFQACLKVSNVKINRIVNLVALGSSSSFSNSLMYLCTVFNCNRNKLESMSKLEIRNECSALIRKRYQDVDDRTVHFILCVLDERDYMKVVLTRLEANAILSSLCTD